MAFERYASVKDLAYYMPMALADLCDNDEVLAGDALRRAAREINERLAGMDRFSVVPVATEPDGTYAEVLVRLNVYMAMWDRVVGLYAGEAFEDQWRWIRLHAENIWTAIQGGVYSFGSDPASTGVGVLVHLRRMSV